MDIPAQGADRHTGCVMAKASCRIAARAVLPAIRAFMVADPVRRHLPMIWGGRIEGAGDARAFPGDPAASGICRAEEGPP
ncbi:MAG: hypothetical protein KO206_04630 [Methanomicrobiaceae archaeon]|nr:hypothetical protein [Methanomicrobiaceae archaeon]MDD5418280.1 hypothetical protein [Methanomicrobiaceae archaeon]